MKEQLKKMLEESCSKGVLELLHPFALQSLTGDASTRNYFRIKGAQTNYIACIDLSLNRENVASSFLAVHRAFVAAGVRVPQIYDHNVSSGYILQEDLGDLTFLVKLSEASHEQELELYKKALDILLKIHSVLPTKHQGEAFTKQAFDSEKLMSEIRVTFDNFLVKLLAVHISSHEEKVIIENFGDLCGQLAARPRVLTHRDYHSRNIMIKNGEPAIIDFQDARMGIPQYDLVSLLEDCYYKITPTNKSYLKKYYFDHMEHGTMTEKDFEYYYDLMAIQRIFKAIGSFSYINFHKKDPRYLKYIGFSFENLRSFLMKYPQWDELRKTLSRFYYAS